MRVYFAFNGLEQLPTFEGVVSKEKRLVNILLSFEYDRLTDEQHKRVMNISDCKFIYDSGAFTVWKTGGTVNINEYIERLLQLKAIYGNRIVAINLDVIPGKFGSKPSKSNIDEACKKSLENYHFIKDTTGMEIMPVFHQHDDWAYLETYKNDNCFVLGISPANDIPTLGRMRWLDKVFSILKDTKRTHGLAATSARLIERYPWYSCDSASWIFAAANGSFLKYENGNIHSHSYKDKESVHKYKALNMMDDGSCKYKDRRLNNIFEMLKMQDYYNELWNKRGVTWTE